MVRAALVEGINAMFAFDTGADPLPKPQAAALDETQNIRIRTPYQSQRMFNRIREALECFEYADDLKEYWAAESVVVDALHLYDPFVAAELTEIYEMQLSCLAHGGAPRPAAPVNPAQQS